MVHYACVLDFSGYKPKTPRYLNQENQDTSRLKTSAYTHRTIKIYLCNIIPYFSGYNPKAPGDIFLNKKRTYLD